MAFPATNPPQIETRLLQIAVNTPQIEADVLE
jgi:hypothetical protein